MKKILMLVLMLTLVFGFSSVMMAQETTAADPYGHGCGPDPIPSPCLPREKAIDVTVTNPLQGVIELLKDTDLGIFPCGDNQKLDGDINFKIRSNGYLKVTLDLQQQFQSPVGNHKLPTRATVKKPSGYNPTILTTSKQWPGLTDKSQHSFTMTSQNSGSTPNAARDYILNVAGQTGVIEAQPAGKYTAKVKITVSVPGL